MDFEEDFDRDWDELVKTKYQFTNKLNKVKHYLGEFVSTKNNYNIRELLEKDKLEVNGKIHNSIDKVSEQNLSTLNVSLLEESMHDFNNILEKMEWSMQKFFFQLEKHTNISKTQSYLQEVEFSALVAENKFLRRSIEHSTPFNQVSVAQNGFDFLQQFDLKNSLPETEAVFTLSSKDTGKIPSDLKNNGTNEREDIEINYSKINTPDSDTVKVSSEDNSKFKNLLTQSSMTIPIIQTEQKPMKSLTKSQFVVRTNDNSSNPLKSPREPWSSAKTIKSPRENTNVQLGTLGRRMEYGNQIEVQDKKNLSPIVRPRSKPRKAISQENLQQNRSLPNTHSAPVEPKRKRNLISPPVFLQFDNNEDTDSEKKRVDVESNIIAYGDDNSIQDMIRTDRTSMEFQKLRDKLSLNHKDSLDKESEKKMFRLEARISKLQAELGVLHKSYAKLKDFHNTIETKLFNSGAGPHGLSIIAVKDGSLWTRSTGVTKMWKKRRAILTEKSLYFYRQITETTYELVNKVDLSSIMKLEDKDVSVFKITTINFDLDVLTEAPNEKSEWVKLLKSINYQLTNPLARFKLSDARLLIPKLCLNEYRLCIAIAEHTFQKERHEQIIELILNSLNSMGRELTDFITHITKEEIYSTSNEVQLFRANTTELKILNVYAKMNGKKYLCSSLRMALMRIIESNQQMEVFSEDKVIREENCKNVEQAFQLVFDSIVNSQSNIPWQLKLIMNIIKETVRVKFPLVNATYSVGNFFFLRFLCPALVVPDNSKIIQISPPNNIKRGILFITKILQTLANNLLFGSKEIQMLSFNKLIEKNKDRMYNFLENISQQPIIPETSATTLSDEVIEALKSEVIDIIDSLEPVLATTM